MEQNNQDKPSPTSKKPEKMLTEEQRQKRKKMLVYPLMFFLFAGSLWLIFAPSAKDKEKGQKFNTDMPLPTNVGIIGDKQTAYEQAQIEDKQKERNSTMQDLASLFDNGKETAEKSDGLTNAETEKATGVCFWWRRKLPPQTDHTILGNRLSEYESHTG